MTEVSDSAAPVALRLTGVRKTYVTKRNFLGRPKAVHEAVRGVDLEVAKGETLALVGESGAGKTTVGRMALRLIEPDSGSVEILGDDLMAVRGRKLRELRAKATMIFQDPYKSLDPRTQIGYSLAEPMLAQGVASRAERAETIGALLERVGLDASYLERFPYELSGGQLQRIAIARALVTGPSVVVCDEPVAALDMSIRAHVIELMRELQRERDLAYLFVSHDLSLVQVIADRVAVMELGQVVEIGPTEEIFANPRHPYTQSLLDAIPAPHPRNRRFSTPGAR